MANWNIKSLDSMKISQDTATNPPSASHIDTVVSKAKDIGATHIAISVPYDLPNGGGDVTSQTQAWVDAAKKYGLNVWHRHSWCSDQGFYGVAKDNGNDRIQDTVNWITANKGMFRDGDIFTPKPEPQNCGINGVNTGSNYRFSSVSQFNQWIRDMQSACQNAFVNIGMPNMKVGFWGFDGFIICGFGNPDHQGSSFLEKATVIETGNVITGDHYPPSGTTMADFLSVFKKTWPNVQYVEGEYGPIQGGDIVTQINNDIGTLANDPIVIGLNYWVESDNGGEALLDGNLNITPAYTAIQTFFQGGVTPTPTPIPPPVPPPTPSPSQSIDHLQLINTDTQKVIVDPFADGATIDLSKGNNLNINVITNPPTVGSVVFNYDGDATYHTENILPYDIGGDTNGIFDSWTPTVGNHTLTITPYTQSQGKGIAGTPFTIHFIVVDGVIPTPTPQPVTINITGTAVITTDSTGKISLKIEATG